MNRRVQRSGGKPTVVRLEQSKPPSLPMVLGRKQRGGQVGRREGTPANFTKCGYGGTVYTVALEATGRDPLARLPVRVRIPLSAFPILLLYWVFVNQSFTF